MITIIHGDSVGESREHFFQVKTGLENLTVFEGQEATRENFVNFLSNTNLFFEKKNLAVENLLSKNRPSKNLDEMIKLLNDNGKSCEIVLWEDKELSQKTLSLFPKAQIQVFKLPKLIFNFLDGIKPGNGQNLVSLFHKLFENTAIEIIIYMMTRQLRLMIALLDKTNSETIDEIGKIAPWQRGKLERQVSFFEPEELISLYAKLYKLDLSQKTGRLNMPIASAIDILLLDI